MVFREIELGLRIAFQQLDRMPAADARHTEGSQRRLQRIGLPGELVSQLHADETGLAGLGQTGLQRCRAADVLQVVIRPADRVCADADCHM